MTRRRALVADDAPPVRILLESFLRKLEFDVRTAKDGRDALEQMEADDADLVLMDVEMPNLSGDQAALAMLEARPALKIVLMTAVDPTDERLRTLRSYGVHGILHKPVRLEQVRALVETMDEERSTVTRIR